LFFFNNDRNFGVGGNWHVYESLGFYDNQLSPLYVQKTVTDFEMLP